MEKTVTADNLVKDKIDYQNLRYFGSRPRPAAGSAAEDYMMVLVVLRIMKGVEQFEFGDGRGQSSSDGICL
jgi:hypothetical protein